MAPVDLTSFLDSWLVKNPPTGVSAVQRKGADKERCESPAHFIMLSHSREATRVNTNTRRLWLRKATTCKTKVTPHTNGEHYGTSHT